MHVSLFLKSKNLSSIKFFMRFFRYVLCRLNIVYTLRTYVRPTLKKRFTVLKSPHVNKCAQEHFEFSLYSYQITVFSHNYPLLLTLIKYSKGSTLFSDIRFKIKINVNILRHQNQLIQELNPNNFFLLNYLNSREIIQNNSSYLSNISYYLMLFDIYGSLKLSQISVNS